MNDLDAIKYLEENEELIPTLELKALKNCDLPQGYLYVDGNYNTGFSVLVGINGKGATERDKEMFYANFMSLLESHLREIDLKEREQLES